MRDIVHGLGAFVPDSHVQVGSLHLTISMLASRVQSLAFSHKAIPKPALSSFGGSPRSRTVRAEAPTVSLRSRAQPQGTKRWAHVAPSLKRRYSSSAPTEPEDARARQDHQQSRSISEPGPTSVRMRWAATWLLPAASVCAATAVATQWEQAPLLGRWRFMLRPTVAALAARWHESEFEVPNRQAEQLQDQPYKSTVAVQGWRYRVDQQETVRARQIMGRLMAATPELRGAYLYIVEAGDRLFG